MLTLVCSIQRIYIIYTFTLMIVYLLQTRIHCYEKEIVVYQVKYIHTYIHTYVHT